MTRFRNPQNLASESGRCTPGVWQEDAQVDRSVWDRQAEQPTEGDVDDGEDVHRGHPLCLGCMTGKGWGRRGMTSLAFLLLARFRRSRHMFSVG